MNKTKNNEKIFFEKYIIPSTLLSLAFPILPIIILKILFYIGYYIENKIYLDYLEINTTQILIILFLFFIYIKFIVLNLSKSLNNKNQISLLEASSISIKTLGVNATLFGLISLTPLIINYSQEIIRILPIYLIIYLLTIILVPFFYIFSIVEHRSLARKRYFWLYSFSFLTFLVFIDFFIEQCDFKSTSTLCFILNTIYIFIIGTTTAIISEYFYKKNHQSLEYSITFFWIISLMIFFGTIFYPNYDRYYTAVINIIFIPIALGFLINSLSIAIHKDIQQEPFNLYLCKNSTYKNRVAATFDNLLSLLFNLIIILPSYVIHSVILCLFDLKTADQKQLQKNHE